MFAAEMVTAETEEAMRVMAHIRDLNRTIANDVLGGAEGLQETEAVARALRRLEELPFLLGNFRFSDAMFWRACLSDALPMSVHQKRIEDPVPLARHLLCVAWHCGRAGAGPRLLLGIDREVGALIATLRFAQLDAIAVARAEEVSRRWADVPGFWSQMIATAQDGSDQRWSRFQVHALRLLGRECV